MKILVRIAFGMHSLPPKTACFHFIKGLKRCGEDVTTIYSHECGRINTKEFTKYDLIVLWNMRHTKRMASYRQSGKDFLALELGYIGDRKKWFSLGYNGLNGLAEHIIGTEPRWQKLWSKDILKPWSMDYSRVLLVGQVNRDMSLSGCEDIYKWYQDTTDHYCREGLPVIYRPHPLEMKQFCPENALLDESDTLQKAMKGSLVVTYSSNVGVDAVLAGRPTVAVSPVSMVYGWAGRELSEVGEFDREPWLHRMAYCQWSLDELKDGTAWKHYKTHYTDRSAWRTIRHRRSCRSFTGDPIPKELLWKVMEAGMWAPSGSNAQNFRFLLIDDEHEIKRFGELKTPHKIVKDAAACIVVFSDNKACPTHRKNEKQIWSGLYPQNCAAAIQNMLLMASDLCIGSCWIAFLDSMDGTRLLNSHTWRELLHEYNVPPNHSVQGLILLGWPMDKKDGWPIGDKEHGKRMVEGRTLNRFLIGKVIE